MKSGVKIRHGRPYFPLYSMPIARFSECHATDGPNPVVEELAARHAQAAITQPCGRLKAWLARPWSGLRRLGKAQRGVAALEYALVAPLLFGVIFVAVETTVMLFADSSLETAANRVTRIGKLGVPEGMGCEQAVRAEMERILLRWVSSPQELRIDVKIYEPGVPFQNVDDENYVPVCDAGARGDMVMYRLGFDRPGLTGFVTWLGVDMLRFERNVVIQNEP